MLSVIKNLFKCKNQGQLPLGRWGRNNENVKSIYANSDHCGDIICGDPKKVKQIVNIQKSIPQNNKLDSVNMTNVEEIIKMGDTDVAFFGGYPQNNKLDMYKNEEFCCMLFGVNGSCINCWIK
jgi:hypothetical protein